MTIVAAAAVAVVILLAGNLPWAGFGPIPGLMALNLRHGVVLPWAVLPAAVYLFGYWRIISGASGPADGAPERRANLRARPLSLQTWVRALLAGMLGFATLVALLVVASRLVSLPAGAPIAAPPGMSAATMFLLIAMASVVAGVSEEAAFRGYMQSMIERQHGLAIAILANGTLFGLLHFGNHPADVLLMLPYYIAVAAVYGGLTWATDSILPAVVLHSLGDVVVLTRWWLTGKPEWQIGSTAPELLRDTGVDAAFVTAAVAAAALVVATTVAYRALRRRPP
jgi:membrane protease YdiL (CAAX protease family)